MNKFLYLIPIAGLLLFSSCVDFNDATTASSVTVRLLAPDGITVDLSNHPVTMQLGSQTTTALSDENGQAVFQNIVPDVYDISTSWSMTSDEYLASGGDEAVAITLSGSLNSQMIKGNGMIDLQLNAFPNRDIIIGKVYYAGSKDNNNKTYMAGKYIELFNQSEDTVDVSGLYIGMTESESTQAWTLTNLNDTFGYQQAILLKQIYRIPTDEPYYVAPGGTVLICNSATDHTDGNDNENDLRDADFEVKDTQGNYQNNPNVPAMEMIYQIYNGTSIMNLVQSGPTGVVIFRTDENIFNWRKVYKYGYTTGLQFVVCPTDIIQDGIEALRNKTTGIEPTTKRLHDNIDAGYTYINAASGWNAEVVYRKTKSVQNGHKVLVDTNNSSNDFQVSSTIKPREYDDYEE
jgi:hypothetical protein